MRRGTYKRDVEQNNYKLIQFAKLMEQLVKPDAAGRFHRIHLEMIAFQYIHLADPEAIEVRG